jgi:hypothetical protein
MMSNQVAAVLAVGQVDRIEAGDVDLLLAGAATGERDQGQAS